MTSESTSSRSSPARRRLTDLMVRTARLPAQGTSFLWDKTLPRFGAALSAGGSRKYVVQARVLRGGELKAARATIGSVDIMPIEDAREAARDWLRRADAGENPIAESKAATRAKVDKSRQTVQVMVDAYLDAMRDELRPRSWVEVRRTLERIRDGWVDREGRTLSKPWAERPVTSLTRDDVQGLVGGIKQHNPTTAARTLAYLRAFLSWSRDEGGARGLEVNVAAGVKAPKTSKRTRFLSEDELADVWACLDVLGEPAGDLFRVMLLTGQRRTEGCAAMRWDEIDNPIAPTLWTTPGDRAKNHEEHVLPLSRAVAEIIRRRYRERDTMANSPFVFPATRQWIAGKRKSQSDAPTHFSGFNTAKRRLDAAIAKRRAERGDPPMAAWVLHDLRRTLTTHVNGREGIRALIRQLRAEAREAEYRRDGIEITPDLRARIERQAGDGVVGPHVAQQILNHSDAKPGIFSTYDREKYVDDMRVVLEAYARWIVQISTPAAEAPAPNVVRLRAAG